MVHAAESLSGRAFRDAGYRSLYEILVADHGWSPGSFPRVGGKRRVPVSLNWGEARFVPARGRQRAMAVDVVSLLAPGTRLICTVKPVHMSQPVGGFWFAGEERQLFRAEPIDDGPDEGLPGPETPSAAASPGREGLALYQYPTETPCRIVCAIPGGPYMLVETASGLGRIDLFVIARNPQRTWMAEGRSSVCFDWAARRDAVEDGCSAYFQGFWDALNEVARLLSDGASDLDIERWAAASYVHITTTHPRILLDRGLPECDITGEWKQDAGAAKGGRDDWRSVPMALEQLNHSGDADLEYAWEDEDGEEEDGEEEDEATPSFLEVAASIQDPVGRIIAWIDMCERTGEMAEIDPTEVRVYFRDMAFMDFDAQRLAERIRAMLDDFNRETLAEMLDQCISQNELYRRVIATCLPGQIYQSVEIAKTIGVESSFLAFVLHGAKALGKVKTYLRRGRIHFEVV